LALPCPLVLRLASCACDVFAEFYDEAGHMVGWLRRVGGQHDADDARAGGGMSGGGAGGAASRSCAVRLESHHGGRPSGGETARGGAPPLPRIPRHERSPSFGA
jgi:hypothetical protein